MKPWTLPPGPARSAVLAVSLVALVVATVVPPAVAQPAEPRQARLSTLDRAFGFQPPSVRLAGMGGLSLAVRDEHTEVNLWDFAGVPVGVLGERDSTSVDLWFDGRGLTLDRRQAGIDREIQRDRQLSLAASSHLRFGDNLAVNADAGLVSFSRALPFSDGVHSITEATLPVLVPVVAGRLFGPVLWGVRGIFGSESFTREWVADDVVDGRIPLDKSGQELTPPHFFAADDGGSDVVGGGISLGYERLPWGRFGIFLDGRNEDVLMRLHGARQRYDLSEPRSVTSFGAGLELTPDENIDLAVAAGREHFSVAQEYRFTISGGALDRPLVGRGDRALVNRRSEYFQVRGLADVPGTKATVGAAVRVAYDRAHQTPAMAVPEDFNAFVTSRLAGDTLVAPGLVREELRRVRSLEAGGGASLKLRDDRLVLGGEFRYGRDAIDATQSQTRRRAWEARAGGELLLSASWTARLGWRHLDLDDDTFTELNESVADRVTLGGRWHPGGQGWAFDAAGFLEWWRTDYPDPDEEGGTASGLLLLIGREF